MEALSPSSSHFLEYEALIPLYRYASTIPVLGKMFEELGGSLTDLQAECRVFSRAGAQRCDIARKRAQKERSGDGRKNVCTGP